MKPNKIIKTLNEYKNYHRIGKHDKKHIEDLEIFIIKNINDIKNCTWYDLAGGFMMFVIEIDNNTYCCFNELYEGYEGDYNAIIYHNLSLKAYIELEVIDYDFSLLLQQEIKI